MKKNSNLLMILILTMLSLVFAMRGNLLAADAETNFKWLCVQCHGVKGQGDGVNVTKDLPVSPRNLTDKKDMDTFSDDQMFNTLTKGGPANNLSSFMPPFVIPSRVVHLGDFGPG